MGVRIIYVVEGRIEQRYSCPRCRADAVARVRVEGAADAGPNERVEAVASALAMARLALDVAPCPRCGARGASWRREWTKAVTLWAATLASALAAALLLSDTSLRASRPLADLEMVGVLLALAALALGIVASLLTATTYGLPHRVQWLDVPTDPPE